VLNDAFTFGCLCGMVWFNQAYGGGSYFLNAIILVTFITFVFSRASEKSSKPSAAERAYMERVAELPCVCCGAPCEELHHPRSLALGCGMGMKAPHTTVIPLCKKHHDELHRIGKRPWEARHKPQKGYVDEVRGLLESYISCPD
jgi:hypothetical protein